MRTCNCCGIEKQESEFYNRSDGQIIRVCKACILADRKRYYKEHRQEIAGMRKRHYRMHKEEEIGRSRRYRETHREERSKWGKRYYKLHGKERAEQHKLWVKTHKEEMAEYQKRYRETHKQEIAEMRKRYREIHKEEIAKGIRRWEKTPEGKAADRRRKTQRRSMLENILATLTANEWNEILTAHGFRCAYCGRPFSESLRATQDHVIPLSRGGNRVAENVVPAYGPCNSSKGAKIMETEGILQ
ncbi:MAG: HNH endonuclease [Deltaproteobacteria bacterium]